MKAGKSGSRLAIQLGYQVPYADAIRREVGVPTVAVGLILEGPQAEAVLAEATREILRRHPDAVITFAGTARGIDRVVANAAIITAVSTSNCGCRRRVPTARSSQAVARLASRRLRYAL